MKEIKFRAWNKAQKEYVRVNVINFELGTVIGDKPPFAFRFDDLVIEQFTGIKDKNGKEIYEGDIVNLRGELRVVEYSESDALFITTFNVRGVGDLYEAWGREYGVVGNIHENKSLLKGK